MYSAPVVGSFNSGLNLMDLYLDPTSDGKVQLLVKMHINAYLPYGRP